MQIIVVGCGKVGSSLAAELLAQDHDVVIVEGDQELMHNADHLDCVKIIGVPIDRDILRQAGIETADVVCAATQTDNINIMVSQIASDVFHVPLTITRIFNPANRQVFDAFGLNTVGSTDLTVQAFLRKLSREEDEREIQIYQNSVLFSQMAITEDWAGETISELEASPDKMIVGLLRQGVLILASPELEIEAGDRLVLVSLQ
ncbi:MAG: NAD-binding protein [Eubacteriales bacterium]|nr:NAD-binding protein [Eubacteriales bacterium]